MRWQRISGRGVNTFSLYTTFVKRKKRHGRVSTFYGYINTWPDHNPPPHPLWKCAKMLQCSQNCSITAAIAAINCNLTTPWECTPTHCSIAAKKIYKNERVLSSNRSMFRDVFYYHFIEAVLIWHGFAVDMTVGHSLAWMYPKRCMWSFFFFFLQFWSTFSTVPKLIAIKFFLI